MSLASRTQHAFSSRVRKRGAQYERAGQVALFPSPDEDELHAEVMGSEADPYRVCLVRLRDGHKPGLGVSCTCPHFEEGEPCKHIWALILHRSRDPWARPLLRGQRRLEVLQLGAEVSDLGSHSDEDRDAAVHLPVPPARASARDPAGSWRSRLASLASGALAKGPGAAPRAAPAQELYYGIELGRVREMDEVVLSLYTRRRLRSGRLGVPSPHRPRREDVAKVADASEAQALELLVHLFETRWMSSSYLAGGTSVPVPTAIQGTLFPQLAATGRFGLFSPRLRPGREEVAPFAFDPGPPLRMCLSLERTPVGLELACRFEREGASIPLAEVQLVLPSGLVFHGGTLSRCDANLDTRWLEELQTGLRVPARDIDEFVTRLLATPGAPAIVLPPDLGWVEERVEAAPRLRFRHLAASGSAPLGARLDFRYGEIDVECNDPMPRVLVPATRRIHPRDSAAEAAAEALLESLGFAFLPPLSLGPAGAPDLRLPAREFEAVVVALLQKGFRVETEGKPLRQAQRSWASVASGIDFFEVAGGVDFGAATAPFPELLAAAREGRRFVRLGDGSHGLLPREWLARSAALAALAHEEGDRLRFSRNQAALLDVWLEAQQQVEVDRDFALLREKLARFGGIEPRREPPGFAGSLRGYQREGLGWLCFLAEFGLGGCLADDMGLGKTVQVLALLAQRKTAGDETPGPSLVVAPLSVIHNWIDEAGRFAPGLSVLDYRGSDRADRSESFAEHDLVLTTYGTLLRDAERLAEQPFDYVILDEAQAIKNAQSRTARAVRALRARHRLALTGTPVENHLGELGSLFEFLNPGMLGRSSALRALASPGALEAGGDQALDTLRRALRPFILRRVKTQVLEELPEKTEQVILCELDKRQRRLYDELRDHYRESLGARIAEHGLARSKIHVLEALLRLRQAACHPALVAPRYASLPSAKLDALYEQLEELVSASHKALVFSQFTELLGLVRKGLDARGIAYAYLDGKTRNRRAIVERFQKDADCPLFLISLKAGGLGLNLTAAEYVFLLDPWWNPAVEAQAIDRAHRMGQERPVFAYRLIARGTIEEKILELQNHKRRLVEAVIGEDAGGLASLTAEDLEQLFT